MYQVIISLIKVVLNTTGLVSPRVAGWMAFRLFCHPAKRSKIRAGELPVHTTATQSQITVNNKTVVVYQWGTGKCPVLLLHGWESRGSRYAAFVPQLVSAGFSPITFDAPGHGDSMGESTTILEYRAIIAAIQARCGRFRAVIAHSFGVLCAFYAVRSGIRTDRLVAVSGVCDFAYLAEEFSDRLSLSKRIRSNLRARIEALFFPETDIWQQFSASHHPHATTCPILVIHDAEDDVVDVAQANRIMAAYSDRAHLLITRELGHSKTLSDQSIVRRVIDFVRADAEEINTNFPELSAGARPCSVNA